MGRDETGKKDLSDGGETLLLLVAMFIRASFLRAWLVESTREGSGSLLYLLSHVMPGCHDQEGTMDGDFQNLGRLLVRAGQ